jgi:hypothetical protein
MDDEDVKSIVVYLRTLPAVKHVVPTRPAAGAARVHRENHPEAVDDASAVASGIDASGARQVSGHDRRLPRLPHRVRPRATASGLAFGGGGSFDDPALKKKVFSLNITQDPSGIAHYDESLFIQTIRTGQVTSRLVNHIMPFEFFKNMTDDDLRDIFAFIKSVPPVKHRISNTDPPTMCPVCNQSHGLGELNVKK